MNKIQPKAKLVGVDPLKILLVLGVVLLIITFAYLKLTGKIVSYSIFFGFFVSVVATTIIIAICLENLMKSLTRKCFRSNGLTNLCFFLWFRGRYPTAFLLGVFVNYLGFRIAGLI